MKRGPPPKKKLPVVVSLLSHPSKGARAHKDTPPGGPATPFPRAQRRRGIGHHVRLRKASPHPREERQAALPLPGRRRAEVGRRRADVGRIGTGQRRAVGRKEKSHELGTKGPPQEEEILKRAIWAKTAAPD